MQNNSGKWWMLSKSGDVIEGESNPDAASVLAAPGAEIPDDVVKKHDLAKRLDGPAPPMVDAVGGAVTVVDGRSISVDILPADHPSRVKAEAAPIAKVVPDPPKPALHQPPVHQPPKPTVHQPPKPGPQS